MIFEHNLNCENTCSRKKLLIDDPWMQSVFIGRRFCPAVGSKDVELCHCAKDSIHVTLRLWDSGTTVGTKPQRKSAGAGDHPQIEVKVWMGFLWRPLYMLVLHWSCCALQWTTFNLARTVIAVATLTTRCAVNELMYPPYVNLCTFMSTYVTCG